MLKPVKEDLRYIKGTVDDINNRLDSLTDRINEIEKLIRQAKTVKSV